MEIKASAGELAYLMEEFHRLSSTNIEGTLEVTDDESERTDEPENGFPHVRLTENGGIFINGQKMEAVTDVNIRPAFYDDRHTVKIEFETPYIELENGELSIRK